ncbi:DUF7788 domain-containing protein [Massilibacterium senegalense]
MKQEATFLIERWETYKKDWADFSENTLAIIDVSGSMHGKPLEVAVSMFIAEKNQHNTFDNTFIPFSNHPELIRIIGHNLVSKTKFICQAN